MNYFKLVWKTVVVWIALLISQIIGGIVVHITAPRAPNTFIWLLASNLVVASVLTLVAINARVRGWRLALALSGFPFVIGMLNVVEAVVFLGHSGIDAEGIALHTVIVAGLLIPVWRLLFGRQALAISDRASPLTSRTWLQRAWRFALSDVAYVFVYFLAGMIIYPFVKDFYAKQTLPSVGKIVALQLAVRGPAFVGVCLLLMRLLDLPRASRALAVGLAFAMLSGVAPMILPNPYFPDAVRWVHLCEVSSSNFVFGVVVAWIWSKPTNALVAGESLRPG